MASKSYPKIDLLRTPDDEMYSLYKAIYLASDITILTHLAHSIIAQSELISVNFIIQLVFVLTTRLRDTAGQKVEACMGHFIIKRCLWKFLRDF